MHESCGKNVLMPSSRYLILYADALNLLSNNQNDFIRFSSLIKSVSPEISEQTISIAQEAIKITQLN